MLHLPPQHMPAARLPPSAAMPATMSAIFRVSTTDRTTDMTIKAAQEAAPFKTEFKAIFNDIYLHPVRIVASEVIDTTNYGNG